MSLKIDIRYPTMQVEYHWPQGKIQQKPTTAEIEYQGPEVIMELSEPLNELGMGSYGHFSQKIVTQSNQTVAEGTARRAQEGDRAASKMTSQDTFIRIAREQNLAGQLELNVDVVPKSRPQIDFKYAMQINWHPGEVNSTFQVTSPTINWDLGEVKIDIKG